jgi:hypothetical protein
MRISIQDQSRFSLNCGSADKGLANIRISSPASSGGGGSGEPAEDFVETTGPSTCGSFVLAGNATSYMSFSANSGLDFGTGPFTIEWWQYQTDGNSWPRVFARGTYGSTTLGLSIEGGSVYFWDSGANFLTSMYNYKNRWLHFAVTRSINNKLRFFIGGQLAATIENYTHDFTASGENFMIGVEGNPSNGSSFGGNISNFHIMKGAARYIRTFNPSSSPLKMTNKSVLMMYSDSAPNVVMDATNTLSGTGSNVTWSASNPFS